MDGGEHLEIGADDLGVRRHSHGGFHAGRRLAVLILYFEAQDHWRIRANSGAVAMPHDPRAGIEYVDERIRRRSERERIAAAVVTSQRRAVYLWQIDRADKSPGKSAFTHDVGEHAVAARLN